jgi:homoserine/homoserine lactone efflux protein
MTWQVWWMFLLTETVLSISPGPTVLLVISQSLRSGTRCGLWAALGILSANAIWFGLSALGIGAAIVAAGDWFVAIKWLGAGYLVYLALKPIWAVPHSLDKQAAGEPIAPAARQLWMRGLLLQLTNPKALLFFAALLPQFVRRDQDVASQILILGITSMAAELPVLALYAALAGQASRVARGPRFARAIDCLSGALLIAAALGLAMIGQPGAADQMRP